MNKDNTGYDNALALPRCISVDATRTLTVDNELVDATTTAAGAAITLTLPSVAESRDKEVMVRFIAKNTTKTVTVVSGSDSWIAISAVLSAANDYVVLKSNGRTWYIVSSKLT
jgi:hypothetical protein